MGLIWLGGLGVVFLALPMPSSRWKQELKKRAVGLPPVGCELQVSRDPTALQPERERSVRSEGKTPRAGGALRGHSAQVGRLGPRERSSGIMVREMASASWSKVKRCDGDDVPLNREKNAPPALRPNS